MRHRLLAPARREYLDAVRWYRDQVNDADLARDFIVKLRQRLERMHQHPHAGAFVTGVDAPFPIRRVKLHRFPYHLFVAVRDEELVVLTVAHERREPDYWAGRLDDV